MKVAISQSNYIPWKGYFDLMAAVDVFVLYDDMQYTRRDWRNRNKIKTAQGIQWLTVPVAVKGKYFQKISETLINGTEWAENHYKTLTYNYRRAAHFEEIKDLIEPIYMDQSYIYLSELNKVMLESIRDYLGIRTELRSSSEFTLSEGKTERLLDICRELGAEEYISGPAAKDYLRPELFEEKGVRVNWFDYGAFPEYPQLWGEFQPRLSILDLMFNCGTGARDRLLPVAS